MIKNLTSFFTNQKNTQQLKEGKIIPSLSCLIKDKFLSSSLFAFILGCLSVGAFPPYYLFPLLVIAFSCLLTMLNQQSFLKRTFALGYWFGFGHFACGFFWISNALTIDMAHLGWLIPLVFIASGSFFGLFTAFPAFLSKIGKTPLTQIICFSAFWTIFEWIRSFFLTGFPWNLLGTVWAFSDTPIQFASIFGTYGLSFLTVLLCSLPALLWLEKTKYRIISLAFCFLIPSFLWGLGTYRLEHDTDTKMSDLKIRIVQPAIPQKMKWKTELLEQNLQTYIQMSQKKSEIFDKPDIIIWGETATPFILRFEPQYISNIRQAIPEDSYLITGAVDYQHDGQKWRPTNSLQVIDNFGILTTYNKSHLVPFGEYIPFRKYLPSSLKPITNVISDFIAGQGVKTFSLPKIPDFGALICYEVIFPAEVVNKDHRPYWLINLTNDGWYGLSSGPYQHLVSAQMRAVEEGLTLVRAANSGISAVISKNGHIIKHLKLNHQGNLDFFLPANLNTKTLYSQYHNLPILILCILLILIVFIMGYKKN